MGLEPTTFCMASASDVRMRSRPFAQTACLQGVQPSDRTGANSSERRTLPFLPRRSVARRLAEDRASDWGRPRPARRLVADRMCRRRADRRICTATDDASGRGLGGHARRIWRANPALQRIAVRNDSAAREADRISACVPNVPAEDREIGRQLSHETVVKPRRAIPGERKAVSHQA